ncbi:CDC45 family [Penicillium rubens]|nr:CDC45 family [Penicillium rubens]
MSSKQSSFDVEIKLAYSSDHHDLSLFAWNTLYRSEDCTARSHKAPVLGVFRIAVVKDGPDVKLFRNPGALTKLALWIAEAIRVQEKERGDSVKLGQKGAAGTPLVLAGLDEDRHLYVVVGTGGGGGVVDFAAIAKRQEERKKKKDVKEKKQKERSERRSQRAAERAEREEEIVQETNARVRIDSFEHCVVKVQKDDLGGFLEALSFRSVVG